MAQRALAEEYAARIEGLGPISVHRYFGGASLRADGVQFGFVMKGVLYLKADEVSRDAFERHGCAPFSYVGAAGPVTVTAYYEAPGEVLDDAEGCPAGQPMRSGPPARLTADDRTAKCGAPSRQSGKSVQDAAGSRGSCAMPDSSIIASG